MLRFFILRILILGKGETSRLLKDLIGRKRLILGKEGQHGTGLILSGEHQHNGKDILPTEPLFRKGGHKLLLQ